MPLRILKIAVTIDASEIRTNPSVERFFHTVPTQVTEGEYTILVGQFETDTGAVADELPVLATSNSYYNVYINGVLQMEGLSTYTPGTSGQLTITVGEDETIEADTPIVLEVVNFEPDADIEANT